MPPRRRKHQKDAGNKNSNSSESDSVQDPRLRPSKSTSSPLLRITVLAVLFGVFYYVGLGLRNITRTIPDDALNPLNAQGSSSPASTTEYDELELEARDASIFRVQELPGKGMGVVAVRDIQRGELIIRERPLFVLPSQVTTSPTDLISQQLSLLSTEDQHRFFNLSYVDIHLAVHPHLDEDDPENILEKALAIFQTNSVTAGDGKAGIFPRMARLNHACSSAFNVVYSWREREGVLVVYALKDVKKGKELLTTYTDTKRSRDQRRAYLNHQYSFHCTCDVCSLPDLESIRSDQRLMSMSEMHSRFATWGSSLIDGEEAIGLVRRIWEVGGEEGYWSERGRLAADAAWVAAAHQE
ncbi:hypothetical protein GYMLUDRAFT_44626 [Collybiopsis luxurians FD-317 M1]|uniref:SET domain-containing protein n=1 Tax=Collybiopsis luxurians FD-317 M1 TaxID=944289 RepID=A0A0D0CL49_9AGAR|nr:hypothetical protein GYMLUDRAFT_44626 [Collybiopsis luxurians FD-317 M1]